MTPTQLGELTPYQLMTWYAKAGDFMRLMSGIGGMFGGAASKHSAPTTERDDNINDAFGEAVKRMKQESGRDKFGLGEVMNYMGMGR